MNSREPDYLRDLTKLDNLLEEIREEALNKDHVREEMDKLKKYSLQTYKHGLNVCRRVSIVGLVKQYGRSRIVDMATAALLLDAGYQMIPRELIERKGMLKDGEFEEVKQHVMYSAEIARNIGLPENIVEMIENHHERNNGYGYLNRVALCDYPIEVQLVAACDCFEALKETRPYRARHSLKHAVELMKYQIGSDFDLEVVLDVTNTLIFE